MSSSAFVDVRKFRLWCSDLYLQLNVRRLFPVAQTGVSRASSSWLFVFHQVKHGVLSSIS